MLNGANWPFPGIGESSHSLGQVGLSVYWLRYGWGTIVVEDESRHVSWERELWPSHPALFATSAPVKVTEHVM